MARNLIIALILVIAAGVVGYFIGKGAMSSGQSASVLSSPLAADPNGIFVWWNGVSGVCTINYTYNGQATSTTVPVDKAHCRNYVSAQQPVLPTASAKVNVTPTTAKPSTTVKSQ